MITIPELNSPPGAPRIINFVTPADEGQQLELLGEFSWLLAATGHRVLAAAGTTTTRDLGGTLGSFPAIPSRANTPGFLQALGTELGDPSVRDGGLNRFVPPGQAVPIDVCSWQEIPATFRFGPTAHAAAAVRAAVKHWPYDVVLLTCPAAAAPRVAALCDLLVVSFPPSDPDARAAAALVRDVRATHPVLDLVGLVPCPVREDPGRIARHLGTFQRAANAPVAAAPDRWHQLIKVPWSRSPGAPPLLTTLIDDPAEQPAAAGITAGFETLAGLVFQRVTELRPQLPSQLRARYRNRISKLPTRPERISLGYASADRGWAEWIIFELSQAGVEAAPLPWDGHSLAATGPDQPALLLLGPPDRYPDPLREPLERLLADPAAVRRREILYVRIPDPTAAANPAHDLPHEQPGAQLIDLAAIVRPTAVDERVWNAGPGDAARREQEASARLRAPLLLPAHSLGQLRESAARPPRFPLLDHRRVASNVAAANHRFVGRDRELDTLRTELLATSRHAVTGSAGAGKSEIAREYVNRFRHDYDITWWVPAHDSSAIGASLRQLRDEPAMNRPNQPGWSGLRWLLVFDDAHDPSALHGHLPFDGDGHVIVTTREPALAGALPVGWLSDEDSVRLLTRRLPFGEKKSAIRLARELMHSPMALHLAETVVRHRLPHLRAAGLRGDVLAHRAIEEYLADLPGGAAAVARALTVTLDDLARVGQIGRLAIRLATVAMFLSTEGASLRLLRSTAMLEQLSEIAESGHAGDGEVLTSDALRIDEVLRMGDQFGLFLVDWKRTSSLRLHRTIKEALRDTLDPRDVAAAQRAALAGLARYAPNEAEIEDARHVERQRELHRHLVSSGALQSGAPQIRRWVIKQLRYAMLYSGDSSVRAAALAAAEELRERWAADPGDHPELLARLDQVRSNLYHAHKRPADALAAQGAARDGLRQALGGDHVRTFHASDFEAWYLRTLGDFSGAVAPASTAYEGLRRRLGPNHPLALRAASNYARALALAGEVRRAVELEEDTLGRWRTQVGRRDEMTWQCAAALGRYLHFLGFYQRAIDLLEKAEEAALAQHRVARAAAIRRDLAAIHRARGEYRRARQVDEQAVEAHRDAEDTTASTWERFACQLALASDEFALGKPVRAMELADRIRGECDQLEAGHPCRYLFDLNLGVFQCGAGHPDQARQNIQQAYDGLRGSLGERHPWSLAAAVDLLALADVTHSIAPSNLRQREVVADCRHYLGERHPFTAVAVANARATGSTPANAQQQDRTESIRWIVVDLP